MKKKIVFGFLALFFIVGSFLYAQDNAKLKSGVYQLSGYSAELVLTSRGVLLLRQDGQITRRGKWEQIDNRISVRWDDKYFEAWLVAKSDVFYDTEGNTWFWVRNVRDSDLGIR